VDIVKTTIGSMELPHWLIVAGALLTIIGLIGGLVRRKRLADLPDDRVSEPLPERRAQLAPLPDLLDSRPRKERRSIPPTDDS